MSEIDNLEKQIELLKQQLISAREKERQENLAKQATHFTGFRIHSKRLKFNFHPRRSDIIELLRSIGAEFNGINDISLDPVLWDEAEKNLLLFPNVDLSNITDEMRQTWREYVPPPAVLIRFDKGGNYIAFDTQPGVFITPILSEHSRTGVVSFLSGNGRYVIHPSNIHGLNDVINSIKFKYPLETVEMDDQVKELLSSYLEKSVQVNSLTDLNYVPKEDYVLNGVKFRNYQTQCLELLKHNNGKLIVALEMGLGKTPVSLAFIKETLAVEPKTKFLIVTPAALKPNWSKEVQKYLPELKTKTLQLSGTTPTGFYIERLLVGDENIIYVSYDTLRSNAYSEAAKAKVYPWSLILSKVPNLRLICDEAHYMKNPETANAHSIFAIENVVSITPLTGTPMKNGPKELHSLVKAVHPALAGTYAGWVSIHTYDNGRKASNIDNLRKILQPVMYRRLKRDVIKELPPINRITLEYELSTKAKNSYLDVLNGFYQQLAKWTGDPSDSMTVNGLLAQMIRMKQVCAEDKIDFVADRAIETYDSDESDYRKVIIFSQFANSPPIVESIARKLGGESVWFTGQMDASTRFDLVNKFQTDPNVHFLVASTKAASEGLNITAAGHVIFTDLMWTPADHQQAEGRAYGRMNDLHSITSTYVVAADTIEEEIVQMLFNKITIIAQVVDGANDGASIAMDILALLKSMRG